MRMESAMANQYDTYLNRLRSIKASNPEMRIYERNIQALSQPFNLLNRKVASMTQRGGASTAAQVAALNEGRNQWNQMQNQAYTQALGAQQTRFGNLDEKIAEVEMARDAENDRLKKEKAAKITEAVRSGVQGLAMAAGAAIGASSGNAMAGAQIGSSVGQTASGFVAVDEQGHLTADMERWDTGRITSGAQNTIAAYSSYSNEQTLKSNMSKLNDMMPAISNYIEKNPDQSQMLMYRLQQGMLNNDPATLDKIMLDLESWRAEQNPYNENLQYLNPTFGGY
jgi:hypothetical protein